jgi:hypothetical protein
MKKNGHNLLTWEEMLRVEEKHPFSAGNLRSLRMGGFLARSERGYSSVKRSKSKGPPPPKPRL